MHTSKPSSRGTAAKTAGERVAKSAGEKVGWGDRLHLTCSLSHLLTFSLALVLGAWATPDAAAQALPLEIRQDAIQYNLSSSNGLPLSTTRGTPPGSDGRAPTLAQHLLYQFAPCVPSTSQF